MVGSIPRLAKLLTSYRLQMVREDKFEIYVSEKEKRIIKKNAKLHNYKSVSSFLRELGLGHDISNKTMLAIILTYLNVHLQNYSPEEALDWVRKKQWSNIKMDAMTKFAGMSKDKYEKTLEKLEETISEALEMKEELRKLLAARGKIE